MIITGWYKPIQDAIAAARENGEHVPFDWDGVKIWVYSGDQPFDVRARWREAKRAADREIGPAVPG